MPVRFSAETTNAKNSFHRFGEELFIHLLRDTALLCRLPQGNFYQLAGSSPHLHLIEICQLNINTTTGVRITELPVVPNAGHQPSGSISLSHRKNYRKTFLHELASPSTELSTCLSNLFAENQTKKRKRNEPEGAYPRKKTKDNVESSECVPKNTKRKPEDGDISQPAPKKSKQTQYLHKEKETRINRSPINMQEPLNRIKMFYNPGLITFGSPFKLIQDDSNSLISRVFPFEVYPATLTQIEVHTW